MMHETETVDPASNDLDVTDRRRIGRAQVSGNLVPLLRNPAGDGVMPDDMAEAWAPREPLAPSRGIALALALCTPIWAAIGGLLYLATR